MARNKSITVSVREADKDIHGSYIVQNIKMESSRSEAKQIHHGFLCKAFTILMLVVVLQPVGQRVWRAMEPQLTFPVPLLFWSTHPDRNTTLWPDSWEGRTLEDIRKHLDCASLGQRPIPDRSVWLFLRGIYQGLVGPARSSIAAPLAAAHGFAVGFEVRQTPDRGRGVFATQDVRRGALVYSSTDHGAKFTNANDLRRFLQALPRDLACDVTLWVYVEEFQQGGPAIMVELDEGSLFNDGKAEGSVGCDEEAAEAFPGGCESNYFALRDIKAGEEMLCIYTEFEPRDGLAMFGLNISETIVN